MPLYDASGTAAGVGTATVSATMRASVAAAVVGAAGAVFGVGVVHHVAEAAITGTATVTPTARAFHPAEAALLGAGRVHTNSTQVAHNAGAVLLGVGGVTPGASAAWSAQASLLGAATFTVDHFIASASISGTSQVTAAPVVHAPAQAALHGAASATPTATVLHEAHASLAGSSFMQVPLYPLAGVAAGAGTVAATTMIIKAVEGDAVGSGNAHQVGLMPIIHWETANLAGAANFTVASAVVREIIMGGQTSGQGSIADGLTSSVMGTATGQGTVAGSAFRIVGVMGEAFGRGVINFSEPLPMIGVGNIVAFAEIQKYPPPVCGPICGCENCCGRREEDCDRCAVFHRRFHETGQQPAPGGPSDCDHYRHCERPCWWQCRECWRRHADHRRFEEDERRRHEHEWSRSPNPDGLIGSFRWNQTFGRGDLEICIKDRTGNQRGPVFIGYTMFTVSSTGIMHQVGPTDRKPAQADVGKFYVTGTAGENGQPGCWAVRWRYQRTYSDPIIEQVQQFRVVDAVLDCDRPDHLRRHCKYGWDL